uniref:F-box domain-containing protein n=1 Tax=Guillardia theta TaxID=55529 RepID=A0A7S4JUS7_GUITH|mmetsp:Transcript_18917/g.62171  ORF Transcript_18917/g.62171 Transcript_18917/m.62171 type:complete len:488 (+) Transcript_18917:1073-2536(+)
MSLEFHGFSGRFSSVTSPRDHVAGDAAQTMSNARADADECAKDEFNMLEDLLDESDGEDEALDRKRLGAAEGSSLVAIKGGGGEGHGSPLASSESRRFSDRHRGSSGQEKFRWNIPEEVLMQIAIRVGWKDMLLLCMSVCRKWSLTLRSDVLWYQFCKELVVEKDCCFGQNSDRIQDGPLWKHFRLETRRKIEKVFGELQTGWNWLRIRMEKDDFDEDEASRCRNVVKKLARKEWTQLYDCVALVMVEFMERLAVEVWGGMRGGGEWGAGGAGGESNGRSSSGEGVGFGGAESAESDGVNGGNERGSKRREIEDELKVLEKIVEGWRRAKVWIKRMNSMHEELNLLVERENRKYDAHLSSCCRQAHTPSVYQKGVIAFRDLVLLWTSHRAARVRRSLQFLAQQELLDLSDRHLDLLLEFQSVLEQLDVRDDLTGGGSMRGQAKLRKFFLQPLRQLQCQRSYAQRSGKMRMFGGEMDLIYGPGSEGED